jgi:hypothetical protein
VAATAGSSRPTASPARRALIGYWDERVYSVVQLETDGGEIAHVRTTVNPDKLRFLGVG